MAQEADQIARDADQIAQDYSAMLGSVSVITNVIDDDNDFCNDMTTDEKKARVARSMGYIAYMVAKDFWTDEDMTEVNAAIVAGKAYNV